MKHVWILFWRHLKAAIAHPSALAGLAARVIALLKARGLRGAIKKFSHRARLYDEYPRWVARHDTLDAGTLEALRVGVAELQVRPFFSLLVPLAAKPNRRVEAHEEALDAQIYPYWEIHRITAGGGSCASALMAAKGEWTALLPPGCILPPHTLYLVAAELAAHPEAAVVYADEDRLDASGQRCCPDFKPDWNPALLLSGNYLGSPVFYRTAKLRELGRLETTNPDTMAWELALSMTDGLPPGSIRHIPRILCHRTSGSVYDPEGERRMLEAHLRRKKLQATLSHGLDGNWRVRYALPVPLPLVSMIIPTRNGLALLQQCIRSIQQKTAYAPYEIIVVNNQSDDPATLAYLRRIERDGTARVLDFDAPFNYSALNNFAVAHARGDFLCLLNNDIEAIDPGWLEELVSQASQPEAGAVGAMLYYPDGSVQHAGVLLKGREVATHFFYRMPASLLDTRQRARAVQNLSAVTAACLVVEKKKFLGAGGLDEGLTITCNDVDLCLRLIQAGYHNIWTPHAELVHHESATRGFDDSPARQQRMTEEKALMYRRWAAILDRDPAYNPNLDLDGESYALAFPPRLEPVSQGSPLPS